MSSIFSGIGPLCNLRISGFLTQEVDINPARKPVEVGSWNPIIYKIYTSQVVGNGISEPPTVSPHQVIFVRTVLVKDVFLHI